LVTRVRAEKATLEVTRLLITDAGRRALCYGPNFGHTVAVSKHEGLAADDLCRAAHPASGLRVQPGMLLTRADEVID